MEPLSVLAVAAAVVQFVDYGTRLFTDAREIYKSSPNQTKNRVELTAVSQDLARLSNEVDARSKSLNLGDVGDSEEVFLRLCRECKGISDELQESLAKLQARGTTKFERAANSFFVALKSVWSAKRVEELAERLKEMRQQMMMAVLVFLWYDTVYIV
jgi:hypothetical protein